MKLELVKEFLEDQGLFSDVYRHAVRVFYYRFSWKPFNKHPKYIFYIQDYRHEGKCAPSVIWVEIWIHTHRRAFESHECFELDLLQNDSLDLLKKSFEKYKESQVGVGERRRGKMSHLHDSSHPQCERCNQKMASSICSMFNIEQICPTCQSKERNHPKYKDAVAADVEAVKAGNYNFSGIGLPEDLKPYFAEEHKTD